MTFLRLGTASRLLSLKSSHSGTANVITPWTSSRVSSLAYSTHLYGAHLLSSHRETITTRWMSSEVQGNKFTNDKTPITQPEVPSPVIKPAVTVEKKLSVWETIKHEAVHYWQGTKLLGAEIKISSRLLVKLMRGNSLSRKEMRQLKRTITDLLRLVPFLIIVLIPFLELLLPVILKLFPNMLPSTFESKFQEEEKRRKLLKMRLEMAKFLQETVQESATVKDSASASAEFADFFNKCRSSGQPVPTQDILKFAKKFPDELTLNNLSRPQLVSMAKYMNLNAFGTDTFLRHQIERRLKYLQSDDQMIVNEGVESLTIPELTQVCQSRGIRSIGVSPARMRSELQQWIDLHLKYQVPSSLLLLSRAFTLSERLPASDEEALQGSAEALQATLSSLPHQMVNEAQLKVSEAEGVATYKQKLDVLKEQEEMIQDELEQEESAETRQKEIKEQDAAVKKVKEQLQSQSPETELKEPVDGDVPITASVPGSSEPVLVEEQPVVVDATVKTSESKDLAHEEEDGKLSEEELKKLGEALKSMTHESALEDVKGQLADLKVDQEKSKQTAESSSFSLRVDKMISKIEKQLSDYDSEIGSKLNLVRPDDAGNITISDLEGALKLIQAHPNDDRIKKIIKNLDADGDGLVALQEVLKLVEASSNKEGHGEVVADAKSPSGPVLVKSEKPVSGPSPNNNTPAS